PESSCGYARPCRAAIPTRPSSSAARARAAARETREWTRTPSATWSPTVRTGLRDDSGSWNTMARSLPRTRDSSASVLPSSSSPRSRTEPVTRAPSGRSPITASASAVFPAPDSPTTPSTSPAPAVRHAPRTARTPDAYRTVRSGTRSTRNARPRPGLWRPAADPERQRVGGGGGLAVSDQRAERHLRRPHAEPEVGQAALGDDRDAGVQARVHGQQRRQLRQHMPGEDARRAHPAEPRGQH